MSLRESIPKWVFLSAAKHFTGSISGIDVFVEGTERDTRDKDDWIEIRIDGPDVSEVSKDCYLIESEINLLVATHMDLTSPARHHINIGKATSAFQNFEIFKYGEDAEDDESSVGSFILEPHDRTRGKIKVSNMGQIDPDLTLLQATVEGHFKLIGVS